MFKGHLGAALLEAAREHADRPACWVEGRHYTYRELFEHAAAIATVLRDAGTPPGERVCILSERSFTAYASVIGVLLAGCAYVPMSGQYKPERNNAILRSTEPAAIILDGPCAAKLDELAELAPDLLVICPEAGTAAPGGNRSVGLKDFPTVSLDSFQVEPGLSDEIPVYVIYTSGSTGAPKGVPINSRNVSAYVNGVSKVGRLTSEDRVQQYVELTFDFSVHDLFPTWLAGAELYCVPSHLRLMITRFIAQHGLTSCAVAPASVARILHLKLLKPGSMPTLRLSFFCGEALSSTAARGWNEAASNGRVINLYGPTEATVALTAFEYDPSQDDVFPVVPIGHPFPDQQTELFDAEDRRVAEGETGQMYLAGTQLTEGYWRAPALNAEKFVEVDGVRWYKTGDMARRQEPYGLIFVGRADRQLKIDGYMVELQEIEGILRRVTEREQIAVLAWPRTSATSAQGTVAFIRGEPLDVEAVRSGCAKLAEPHLVPKQFFFLPEFPHNSNGKVDYLALEKHEALQATAPAG